MLKHQKARRRSKPSPTAAASEAPQQLRKKKKKRSSKLQSDPPSQIFEPTDDVGVGDCCAEKMKSEIEDPEVQTKNRKGVIHLATVPAYMRPDKLRHLMEQFGEVGRVYLAPEQKAEHLRRKRSGGNKKLRYCEGWVEFIEKRIARRVADSLNGTTLGGRKRFFRDAMWNIRYLPRFQWHHLKEGTIYDRQVRKARLAQKVSQARRENDFYLEKLEQSKTRKRMAEKAAAKNSKMESGGGVPNPQTKTVDTAAGAILRRGEDPHATEQGDSLRRLRARRTSGVVSAADMGGVSISDSILERLF